MGGKSFILFLALSLTFSVLAAAHRPFVTEKHEAALEPSGMMKSHHNELKTDGQRTMEKPSDDEMNKMYDDMGRREMKGKRLEGDDALKPMDREKNKMHDMGKREMKGKILKHDEAPEPSDEETNEMHDMGKWEMEGEGMRLEDDGYDMGKWGEQVDAVRGDELSMGLSDVPNQEPYPSGGNAGFHLDFGPFGFGGGLEWGGNPGPLYVVPYGGQPYVLVPPYSVPYTTSSPYPYSTPYQQPGPGYGMPQSVQDGPYPSPGGYAQGQGPYQNAGGSNTPNN